MIVYINPINPPPIFDLCCIPQLIQVMETKKLQMKGGTCQAENNPTWLKQPGDKITLAFGAALVGYGCVLCSIGFYRLATGKGKKD